MSPDTAANPQPAFLSLFQAYTDPQAGIGTALTQYVAQQNAAAPLVVIFGTGVLIFDGGPPISTPIRQANPGFIELAAISHLGPALGSLVTLAERGDEAWVAASQTLSTRIAAVRAANTVAFWSGLGVAVWTPHVDAIQRMVDYACRISLDFLDRFQRDPAFRTFDSLVATVLESRRAAFPIPFDAVMIATFCLTGVTGTCSALAFLKQQTIDWSKAMVVLTGGDGGPAAGLTRCTNHLVDLVAFASKDQVKPERTFFIPMTVNPSDTTLEASLRTQWATLYGRSQLAAGMFPSYPRFVPAPCPQSIVTPATSIVHVPPRAATAEDLFAFVARLRFMMEDITQLLSGSVASYVLDQLKSGKAPEEVPIPGLQPFQSGSVTPVSAVR